LKAKLKPNVNDFHFLAGFGLTIQEIADTLVDVLEYLSDGVFLVSAEINKGKFVVWETENLDLDSITP